jgi:SUR7/PalI family
VRLKLNTSRIGQNLINEISGGSSGSGGSFITSLLHNITNTITGAIQGELSSATTSFAHALGIDDFYSLYVLDYCEGRYTPQAVSNATLPMKDIHMNVTRCSPKGGHFNFTPGAAIQATLDRTHTGITLQDLKWPSQIDSDFHDLEKLMQAFLVIYSIAIALAFFTMVASLIWLLFPGDGRRSCAGLTGVIASLAFLAAGVASGLVTAVSVKGDHTIDKYGKDIGVSANRSNKLLALTWASTACLLIATLVGCCGICLGGRRTRAPKSY